MIPEIRSLNDQPQVDPISDAPAITYVFRWIGGLSVAISCLGLMIAYGSGTATASDLGMAIAGVVSGLVFLGFGEGLCKLYQIERRLHEMEHLGRATPPPSHP